ncbi:mechanosensitive ion channel family protein [Shewanella maritima]|uniref:mechanosensitive ion channel family protein n=1 Tax=Shewanella maritima TaxID=2520507 RepID=UPI003736F209
MLRAIYPIIIALACLVSSPSVLADTPQTTQSEIASLQQFIDKDVDALPSRKGEMQTITEYRITDKTMQLREHIRQLMDVSPIDTKYVTPLVQHQLKFLEGIQNYLDQQLLLLNSQLGTDNDAETILQMSDRENQRDLFIKAQFETLLWADKLSIDTQTQKQTLIADLTVRADKFESLVNYNQSKLQTAVEDVANAGADASSEQKALVLFLKTRVEKNIESLTVSAEVLEQLGQDTTSIKKTLFNVSGDITQDVLSINFATSLLTQWGEVVKNQVIENGPSMTFKIFIFLLILVVANLISKVVSKVVSKAVGTSKLNFSKLLQEFFISLSTKAVYALGLLIALSQLGFELGPLLAGFGIAGVIIGFALQDTLSNFASGMMILIYRPYDVGDLINAAGVTGTVSHMSLVSTTVKTLDNQRLIIPNNKIWGDTINNITAEHLRRVDMVFGISYSDNIEHAERVLKEIVDKHASVQTSPEPTIKLHTLNSSSVDFVVRPWVRPEDYWNVYWDITREVKMRFDAEGISIPFPQRDVHIYQTKAD